VTFDKMGTLRQQQPACGSDRSTSMCYKRTLTLRVINILWQSCWWQHWSCMTKNTKFKFAIRLRIMKEFPIMLLHQDPSLSI